MRRFNTLVVIGLLQLGAIRAAQAQMADIEAIQSASQRFIAAIGARDITAMDNVWRMRAIPHSSVL